MRDLKRNQQLICYSLLSEDMEMDEWGNKANIKGYGSPLAMRVSISANKGETSAQPFGADIQYDREMVTHDMNCPIDEYSHLWIDGRSVTDTHNYEVVAVSRSLNCIRYAIRRVNVS